MENCADILPTDGDYNLAGKIQHGAADLRDIVKLFHHGLQGRMVDNIGETQGTDVPFWFEDGLNFFTGGFLAFPESHLFLFQISE